MRSPLQLRARENQTGMPDGLKSGIESLSGMSMDNVRVHYNSNKPGQLNALAYAQGNNIHLAPGQEKHLPHEAWHVVQQAEGRVKPTGNVNGVAINDHKQLEQEADLRGNQAMQLQSAMSQPDRLAQPNFQGVVQRLLDEDFDAAGTTTPKNLKACQDFAKIVSNLVDQAYNELISGNIKDWKGAKIATFLDLLNRDNPMAATHAGNAMEERVYALMDQRGMPLKWTKQFSSQMGGSSYPDIVINLNDGKEGLIDITSDRGHILGKSGGWTTSTTYVYVAEAYFDSITRDDLPNIQQAIKKKGISKTHALTLKNNANNQRLIRDQKRMKLVNKARSLYNAYNSFAEFTRMEHRGDRGAAARYMRAHGLGNLKGVPKLKKRRAVSLDTLKKRRKAATVAKKSKKIKKLPK